MSGADPPFEYLIALFPLIRILACAAAGLRTKSVLVGTDFLGINQEGTPPNGRKMVFTGVGGRKHGIEFLRH